MRQRGIEALESRLRETSDPTSPGFGKHMTHEEIAVLTDTDSSADRVREFLTSRGAAILRSTLHGEYITAAWTVEGWERMFSAEFFHFEYAGGEVVRAREYSLPAELQGHVLSVFNTVQVNVVTNECFGCSSSYCSSWRGRDREQGPSVGRGPPRSASPNRPQSQSHNSRSYPPLARFSDLHFPPLCLRGSSSSTV